MPAEAIQRSNYSPRPPRARGIPKGGVRYPSGLHAGLTVRGKALMLNRAKVGSGRCVIRTHDDCSREADRIDGEETAAGDKRSKANGQPTDRGRRCAKCARRLNAERNGCRCLRGSDRKSVSSEIYLRNGVPVVEFSTPTLLTE